MTDEVVAKGAEAVLSRSGSRLTKHRVEKKYRTAALDVRLRKFRTQREAKILENAHKANVPVPRIFEVDVENKRIVMEYLEGVLLKDVIASASEKHLAEIGGEVGKILRLLHEANIVHNDLTSSNMILSGGKIFLIDFGLSVTSTRIEDKAVDLVVFKRALKATHPKSFEAVWGPLLESYAGYSRSNEVLARASVVEKRARYT
jgi:Kae1-associated kinase Bud32